MSAAELSEEELANLNGRLTELVRESGWTRTMAIGALIVDRVLKGRLDSLGRPQDAGRHSSIRQLASRPECPLKKTALAQTIAVYAVVQRDPRIRGLAKITPAHVAVVTGLPESARYEALVRADSERWSVRTLAQFVASARDGKSAGDADAWSTRQALLHFRNGLKAARVALQILKQQDDLEPSLGKEVASVIRAWTLALSEAGDVVRASKRTSGSNAGTHEAVPTSTAAELHRNGRVAAVHERGRGADSLGDP